MLDVRLDSRGWYRRPEVVGERVLHDAATIADIGAGNRAVRPGEPGDGERSCPERISRP